MWRNFFLMSVILVLSGGILYTALFELDPLGEQKIVAHLAFYLSIFFVMLSFFTFVFFFAAEIITGYKLGNRSFLIAMRRALLIALMTVAFLVLQMYRLLGWPEATLLVIFFGLVEWIFLTRKQY